MIYMDESLIRNQFPVGTQTTIDDQRFLLQVLDIFCQRKSEFNYVEIGSYLGGTLVPFLREPLCSYVMSIDDRHKQSLDERGARYDYTMVSTKDMLNEFVKNDINTDKLSTYDSSIDTMEVVPTEMFDLAFIDGEHTDSSCFRDLLYVLPMMKNDAVILLHDSPIIYKAISIIRIYLKSLNIPFSMKKNAKSDITAIFFGRFMNVNFEKTFGPEQNWTEFFEMAEYSLLQEVISNRLKVENVLTLMPVPTRRGH